MMPVPSYIINKYPKQATKIKFNLFIAKLLAYRKNYKKFNSATLQQLTALILKKKGKLQYFLKKTDRNNFLKYSLNRLAEFEKYSNFINVYDKPVVRQVTRLTIPTTQLFFQNFRIIIKRRIKKRF